MTAPRIVVDASVAGAWSFREPHTAAAQRVLAAIADRRVAAIAPDRFLEEVMRLCQKKTQPSPGVAAVTSADAWERFLDIATSPIVFLPSSELHERAWDIAGAAGITTHDALYVAAAERWSAELWTLDAKLATPSPASSARAYDLRVAVFPY